MMDRDRRRDDMLGNRMAFSAMGPVGMGAPAPGSQVPIGMRGGQQLSPQDIIRIMQQRDRENGRGMASPNNGSPMVNAMQSAFQAGLLGPLVR